MAIITAIVTDELIADSKKYIKEVFQELKSIGNTRKHTETKTFFGLFTTSELSFPNSDVVDCFIEEYEPPGILSYEDFGGFYSVYKNSEIELIKTIAMFPGKGTIGLSGEEFQTFTNFKKIDVDGLAGEVRRIKEGAKSDC